MKKIMSILMLVIVFVSNFAGILTTNTVKAVTNKNEITPYSKGEVVLFDYDGIGIGVEIQMYKKDGVEYPVYCLDKGKRGVEIGFEYSVDISDLLTNQKARRAVINGYPFKTPEELGCETVEEAYAATKMAIYDSMYTYDLDKFTVHKDLDSNKRTVNAIKTIIKNSRNSKETKVRATLNINSEQDKWQVDSINNEYVSKIYNVQASAVNKKYTISLTNNTNARIKITDINNIEKTEFASNEKFKVIIPIADLENAGEFTLMAESDLKTLPVFYGRSPKAEWQNYAVTVGEFEFASTTLNQTYQENKTQIEVQKQDGDSKIPLSNVKFNLLDENKQIIYAELKTNDKGIINIEHILPGNYYLEEVEPLDGYYGYEELIKVEVKLNEKSIVKIDNYVEPEEKPSNEQQEQSEISIGEKKLPKTGF